MSYQNKYKVKLVDNGKENFSILNNVMPKIIHTKPKLVADAPLSQVMADVRFTVNERNQVDLIGVSTNARLVYPHIITEEIKKIVTRFAKRLSDFDRDGNGLYYNEILDELVASYINALIKDNVVKAYDTKYKPSNEGGPTNDGMFVLMPVKQLYNGRKIQSTIQ